jgi:hypothetical protein
LNEPFLFERPGSLVFDALFHFHFARLCGNHSYFKSAAAIPRIRIPFY